MVDPVDPIVEALRIERVRRRWSQRHLAELIGSTQSHVSEMELGRRGGNPTLSKVHAWADALGFDLVLKERE